MRSAEISSIYGDSVVTA